MEHSADLAHTVERCVPRVLGGSLRRLIVLQENSFALSALARFLTPFYQSVHACSCTEAAEHALSDGENEATDLVVAERLANDVSGSRMAATWRARYPHLRRVVLASGCDDLPEDAAALDVVFQKPFDVHELRLFLTS